MRVLVAHNFYRSATPSGENRAVETIVDCLRAQGADVDLLGWDSDDLVGATRSHRLRLGGRMLHTRAPGELADRVTRSRADIVQVHNPVPRLAPGDVHEVRRRGVPVVQVVHNYRHTCLAGSHRRADGDCTDCAGSRWSRAPGVRHRCYRGSLLQSALMAASHGVHHDLWRALDGYVAISEHIRSYLVSAGFPAASITTIPNPVPAPPRAPGGSGRDVLFAGRLVAEKGIGLLLDAWGRIPAADRDGRVLHIAGAGPHAGAVADAAARDPAVEFHGRLDRRDLAALGARCSLSVVPSLWDEPFGLVAVEALAAGRGIVVSARGALPEIASDPDCSWLFAAGRDGLVAGLRRAMRHDPARVTDAALRLWAARYHPDVVGRAHHRQLAATLARRPRTTGPGGDDG
ncbi:MAG: glycosyltransferase [Pseudonocardia sp.]